MWRCVVLCVGASCWTVTMGCGGSATAEKSSATATTGEKSGGKTATPPIPGSSSTEKTASAPVAAEAPAPPAKPTEPPHAHEAAAVLDFRKLTPPAGAEFVINTATRQEVQVKGKVTDVAAVYVALLEGAGCTKNPDATSGNMITDQFASVTLSKAGYLYGLSIYPGEEGKVLATLRNYSNVDTAALPRPAGCETLYGGQYTSVFVTSAKVSAAAAETRKALIAAGWSDVSRPTGEGEAENVTLRFANRGVELSAFIGVAPAQGGKTTIQLSVNMAAHEFPIPPGAEKVVYQEHQGALGCEVAGGVPPLVEFYRKELPTFGFPEKSVDAKSPDRASLTFQNAGLDTVTVSLTSSGGKTRVAARYVSGDIVKKLSEAKTKTTE